MASPRSNKQVLPFLWTQYVAKRTGFLPEGNQKSEKMEHTCRQQTNLLHFITEESVDELEVVINELSNRGAYIILGDFNCHIGNFGGPRSLNAINDRGKYFIALMEKFSLLSVNSQNYCTGPIETYYSNNGKTTVDHVLISENYINLVQTCYKR